MDLVVPDEIILQRAIGTRYDPITGLTVIIQDGAGANAISVEVDERLIIRPRDSMESVKERLSTYRRYHDAVISCFPANCRKFNAKKLQNSTLVQEMEDFLGYRAVSKSPRGFRIIVAGLPGSGKSTIAEKISQQYGAVLGMFYL